MGQAEGVSLGGPPSPDQRSCSPFPPLVFCVCKARPRKTPPLQIFFGPPPPFLSPDSEGAGQNGCHSSPLANERGTSPSSSPEPGRGHAHWASQCHRPSAENRSWGSGAGGCGWPEEEEAARRSRGKSSLGGGGSDPAFLRH